jgi:hypothetical protein
VAADFGEGIGMRLSFLGYPYVLQPPNVTNTGSALRIDASTERNAFKYYPNTTQPITHINLNLNVNGSLAGINWRVRVETDDADKPSGTVLGTESAEFTISAAGWQGEKALGTNTGNLTINQPVWIVLYYSSGTAPTATNYTQMRHTTLNFDYHKIRHFNGSDWTTTSPTNNHCVAAVKHSDGSIYGWGHDGSNTSNSSAPDIFGTNRAGIKFRVGSVFQLIGFFLEVFINGTPNNLEVAVYVESTFKFNVTIPLTQIVSSSGHAWFFDPATAVSLPPDKDIYLILRQVSNGGTDANDYRLRGHTVGTSVVTMLPANMRHVYGTGDNPTTYTVDPSHIPNIVPLYRDMEANFDDSSLNEQWYNSGKQAILEGLNLETASLEAILLLDSYTFDPDHDFVNDISAHEAAGTARVAIPSRTAGANLTDNYGKLEVSSYIEFPTVTIGQVIKGFAVYVDTGVDSTSGLIAYHPFTPARNSDGQAIRVTAQANQLYRTV